MAAISTSDIKNGITLVVENGLFTVIEFQHVKPGKGGAFVRTKLRNSRTGAVIERTYRSDERLEQAIIDKRDTQFLYRDGDDYIFMDQSTYDQVPVSSKGLGEASNFLKETGTWS
jgi:elongation factor P